MRWPGSPPMPEQLLLGCIADDFTGATDLAGTLVRGGMRTIQAIGPPAEGESFTGADAIVIALKSRTAPKGRCCRAVARRLPLAARQWCWPDLFQILLDFRFDPRGQHRTRGRCASGRARRGFHDRLPGISRNQAHDLSGTSLCRRRIALRIGHAASSADADDRFQSVARDGSADQGACRACSLVDCPAGPCRDPSGFRSIAPRASCLCCR